MRGRALIHAARELGVHACNSIGRLEEPFTRRVLANALEQQANRLAHLILIDHVSLTFRR